MNDNNPTDKIDSWVRREIVSVKIIPLSLDYEFQYRLIDLRFHMEIVDRFLLGSSNNVLREAEIYV